MPTCPRLETQRLASACGADKTNTLHAATTANKSRFRFICHPRIVFDQHAAYPPSIGSRLPRSTSTATFYGDSVLHPGGNLRRRIPSDKPTMYGSTLCRVTIEAPTLAWPATPSLRSLLAMRARSYPYPPEQSVASPSLTTGGASLAAVPTSLECPVNLGYSAHARQ